MLVKALNVRTIRGQSMCEKFQFNRSKCILQKLVVRIENCGKKVRTNNSLDLGSLRS